MSNPFNKLKVERDDEEFVTVQSNKNDTLFPKTENQRRKLDKKIQKLKLKKKLSIIMTMKDL